MPINEVSTRKIDTIEAHIETLRNQLDKAERRKAEAVERVTLAEKVITDLKAEIDKYNAEADALAVGVREKFEKADAYAARIISRDDSPAPGSLQYKMQSPEYIESQRAASHRYWHISGKSTPKKACSFCVEEGLIKEAPEKPEVSKTEAAKAKGAYGLHNRWHAKRNITKPDCTYCTEGGNK